jgi:phage-related protein
MSRQVLYGGILLSRPITDTGFFIIAAIREGGKCPLVDWIEETTLKSKSEKSGIKNKNNDYINIYNLRKYFERISTVGIWKNENQIKHLLDNIYELKVIETGLRVFFSFDPKNRKVIILSHYFIKKKQKTNPGEIDTAKKILDEFLRNRRE